MKNFYIKKAIYNDVNSIFKLYNDGVKSGFFKNKIPVTYQHHKKWYKLAIKSKSIFIHICKKKNTSIGYIKYNFFKKQYAVISIIINKKYRKKGVASTLLKRSIKVIYRKYKIKLFYAEVLKKNLLSINFFIKNNFIKVQKSNKNSIFQKSNDLFIYSSKNL